MRLGQRLARVWTAVFLTFAAAPLARIGGAEAATAPTFEERLRAQAAIERVYYAHQEDATRPFEQAVTPDLLRRKVTRYLQESAALDARWHAPITAEALRVEMTRIARDTRAPDRLVELYAALGNDPILIQECLVRPALAMRLSRERFAADASIQAGALREAGWDEWWSRHAAEFDGTSLGDAPVAEFASLVMPAATSSTTSPATAPCLPDDTWTPYLPGGRSHHSAIWTGSVMVVWGGNDDHGLLGNGGRYDPATDTWSPTSLVGAPSARQDHVAVWTGSRMLVWGGQDFSGSLNTGARYDPTTDTWAPMSQAQAPPARRGRGAWTGSRLIVWTNAQGLANAGAAYDPVADLWTPISTTGAPSPRDNFEMTWTGQVAVVWGGVGSGGYLDTGGRYDPSTDTWTDTSLNQAASARYGHTLLWTGSELVVWGGSFDVGDPGLPARYDPDTDTWRSVSTTGSPNPRSSQPAVWTGSRMVIWGGLTSDSASPIDYGGIYDPANDSWIMTQGVPFSPRGTYGHTLTWTGSQVIVFGGNQLSVYQGTPRRFDPETNTWLPTPATAPPPLTGKSVIWTGTQMIGWGGSTNPGVVNTGQRYDPALDSWTPTATAGAPSARSGHFAVWTGTEMLVWGGSGAAGLLVDGGRYDPIADSWTSMSTMDAPSGRNNASAIWTGTEMIVWGGYNLTSPSCCFLASGARYDPATDTWAPTATPPLFARYDHAATWTGSKMLIWGGVYFNVGVGGQRNYVYLNDGALYDAATDTWSLMSTTNAPARRSRASAFWLGQKALIWGGSDQESGVPIQLGGGHYDPGLDSWQATPSTGYLSPYSTYTAIAWTGNVLLVWGQAAYVDSGTGARYDPVGNFWSPMSRESAPPRGGASAWVGDALLVWQERIHRYALSPDADHDGVTACGGDCDDANPSVRGFPAEVDGVELDGTDPTLVSWNSQSASAGPATVYDLVSGTRTGLGPSNASSAACLYPGVAPPVMDMRFEPAVGQVYWYVVRARNSCGTGTYGSAALDSAIPPCP